MKGVVHPGSRALSYGVTRQAYGWPTLQTEYVRRCHGCQFHANVPRQPAVELQHFAPPIPFAAITNGGGMDPLGPEQKGNNDSW